MTRDGKENRFGVFVFDDSQVERVRAGDMSAVGEFIEQNYTFLQRWARKFIRNRLFTFPQDYYEAEEFVNQVFVDFSFYDLSDVRTLVKSINRSFFGIGCGGYCNANKFRSCTLSLNSRIGISSRSGERENGAELGDLLSAGVLSPLEALEQKEDIEENAPYIFREVGRVFDKRSKEFREVIETIFVGMSFEEVQNLAGIE